MFTHCHPTVLLDGTAQRHLYIARSPACNAVLRIFKNNRCRHILLSETTLMLRIGKLLRYCAIYIRKPYAVFDMAIAFGIFLI